VSEIRNDVVVDFSQSDSHGGKIGRKAFGCWWLVVGGWWLAVGYCFF
jgi:hypothetical protein